MSEQLTEEWFADRLGFATASHFGDIMARTKSGWAASRKNYAAQLVCEILTGEREEGWTSKEMAWGIDYEPVARVAYELSTGNTVDEVGFIKHAVLRAGASPDGLIGSDGVLEIKCPNTATHIETLTKRTVPYQYKWQVQGQLWITGRKWADFVSYDPRMPEGAQLIIVRVERDDEAIGDLEDSVINFIDEVNQTVDRVRAVIAPQTISPEYCDNCGHDKTVHGYPLAPCQCCAEEQNA